MDQVTPEAKCVPTNPEEKTIEKPLVTLPYLKVIHEYCYLEFQVQRILDKFCAPFCKLCTNCCCRKEICDESIDSYWLELVWRSFGFTLSNYNDNTGWLTRDGCKLTVGRPPVCYDFLCNRISNCVSKNTASFTALRKIAHLIAFSGKNAIGNKPLVTLTAQETLYILNYQKLSNSITKSLEMFDYYESVLDESFESDCIV